MNSKFHTPSFGDEEFNLADVDTAQTQQPQQIAKRFRHLDESNEVYYSASEDSFGTMTTASATINNQSPKPKPPLSEPKKPVSAYALFFKDTVSAIKAQKPDVSFTEISAIVASMWDALDPTHKNVYHKKSDIAKKEFLMQMSAYRQQQQQQQQPSEHINDNHLAPPNVSPRQQITIASKPAVFTISRTNSDSSNAVGHTPTKMLPSPTTQQHQSLQPAVYSNDTMNATPNPIDPQQIQMLTDAGSVQKCIRENCSKRAIINPDWEDEYCSNECVVTHCRNVFNAWVQSNLEARLA